ncbi:hypothetical protein [Actinocrispum wychmicini]|uniref:Mce-associated membrane protein n=1 Tax=Actinocrispum wychmicini TaxID=1213861 RepID=A0A4R2IQ79_9PSEU|nr:hypothetical protein [Actinocrispum wychmicini]TCO46496.1 Mce-associated membrane protein [Actinocrispum wychmicini]
MTLKRPPTRRPRVAGHRRLADAQVVGEKPEVDDDETVDEVSSEPVTVDPPDEDDVLAEEPKPRSALPLALVAVAAVLAGVGVFFLVKADNVDKGGDTRALTEVNGQIKEDLQKVLSFSYDKLDETTKAARDVLAGSAVDEYDKLVRTVREQAPVQKLVLATRVTSVGAKSVDADHAELLVFLDQVATRVDTGKNSGSAAALTVRAERQNGQWKITELIPR